MLRTLMHAVCVTLAANAATAQTEDRFTDFAPGAQGAITQSIPGILERAEENGTWLRDQITPQTPAVTDLRAPIEDLRRRALNNPRVRALLGTDTQGSFDPQTEAQRYANQRAFLFASFSLPEPSLRAMMGEAQRFDVPIIFRGFVNNSVYDTQVAIQRVFGDDAETIGFTIDPTLFTRFDITRVPQVVVTRDLLSPCETQGCTGDIAPSHDRIAGNIPLQAALELVAREARDSGTSAQMVLAHGARK